MSRTGDDFVRYHGKFMVADDTLHLFGFNFTTADLSRAAASAYHQGQRAVREAIARFEADSSRQPSRRKRSSLVVSPGKTRRETLTAFVKGAKRQLLIYDVNLQDPVFIKILKQQVRGRRRRPGARQVQRRRQTCSDSAALHRLHARAIVRDGSRAFVGSRACGGSSGSASRSGVVISTPPSPEDSLTGSNWTGRNAPRAKAAELVEFKPRRRRRGGAARHCPNLAGSHERGLDVGKDVLPSTCR